MWTKGNVGGAQIAFVCDNLQLNNFEYYIARLLLWPLMCENVPVSSKKMIMVISSRMWDANWMAFPRLCSKLMVEQEIEASCPECLLSTCCVFSLTKPQIICFSEATHTWTKIFATLQAGLDWAKNGQRLSFPVLGFAMGACSSASLCWCTYSVRMDVHVCVCWGSGEIPIKDIAQAWCSLTDS